MFEIKRTTNAVIITRVRNGFYVTEADDACRGLISNPYVFTDLTDVMEFLTRQDFECTDE